MPNHNFKEHGFISDGLLNGVRTCINEFICRECKTIIQLPLGMSPADYPNEACKGKPLPPPKQPWKHPIKGERSCQT